MYNGAIFPLFYLPSIEYIHKLLQYSDRIILECEEHFPKQTYRNRASIQSPNGKLDLTIPVLKGSTNHTRFRDVKICYDFDWQRLHWLSLQTCYRSSAYFEFYENDFAPFYEKRTEYLFDYNQKLLDLLLKLFKINISYSLTIVFQKDYSDFEDYRSSIHPKIKTLYQTKPYFQVFEDRNGFMPNLSAIDLLFNQGPQSRNYI